LTLREAAFAATLDGSTGQGQIGQARHRFLRWLGQTEVDPETVEELAVVFSELAANAVAASPAGTRAHLRAYGDDTAIVLEAVNGSPRTNERLGGTPDLTDPLRPGGRGLLIVKAYMDTVQVEPADHANGTGILVRCRRDLVSV
jgi:anti-sigma regulatory factor (Ser/Thr protein kinase)